MNSHKTDSRKHYFIHSILTILFIGGIILTILEINIYRQTLVSWTVITGVWVSSGLIAIFFTSPVLTKHYETKSLLLKVVYNTVAFGGIVTYCFMALNFYFSSDKQTIVTTEIIKTGRLAKGRHGCGKPYADVFLKGQPKELVFPCGYELGQYRYVKLSIKKGLLGFDLIRDIELVKE
jgi:hypothetical protein